MIRTFDLPPNMSGEHCEVDGCKDSVWCKGLCQFHYRRHKEGVALDAPIRGKITVCTIEGCGKPFYAKGMCNLHYQQSRKKK